MVAAKQGQRSWIMALLLILLAMTAAACGGADAGESKAAQGKPQAAPVKRTLTHSLGTIEVDADIQRVVTLERSFADHLVSLGVVPVGSVVRDGGDFEPYLAPQLKGTTSVGQSTAPNLEKILELKPQLIIGTDTDHSKSYDTLKQIAPTLIVKSEEMENDWRAVYLRIAEAMNKQKKAEADLKAFDDRLAQLKTKLDAPMKDKTVVFFKVTDKDTRVLGNLSPLGKIAYGQLGLNYPKSLKDEKNETKLAIEVLPELNPHTIFVMDTNVPDYTKKLNETLATPLWKNLQAVKDGRVSMVPLRATKTGFGLVMHQQFVDALEKGLLGK
ncbi:putative siderophore-binding lipoprotein YfiY [Paenibacillus solanacearum]|uniref:Siderophore-binding lipoprotein YfiY n=1 Tax=Paenibacillus solanacearum TaxID=2048548 RepID=A0A916K787_9BACL|nr:iron-siderophore ABC transporter substrate-binding protein [Paenibacillus solanacearum]CAG7649441.1 putative siderophore-binding lipoprotein YfiY [Paenibacillus solanacearum]